LKGVPLGSGSKTLPSFGTFTGSRRFWGLLDFFVKNLTAGAVTFKTALRSFLFEKSATAALFSGESPNFLTPKALAGIIILS